MVGRIPPFLGEAALAAPGSADNERPHTTGQGATRSPTDDERYMNYQTK